MDAQFFGWGRPELSVERNLGLEAECMDATPGVCLVGDAIGASQPLPGPLARIKKEFKFDEGWSFLPAEAIAYELTDGATLMVTQNIGNCVGNSHGCLLASRIAHEIVLAGDMEVPLGKANMAVPFIAFSYGVGRMEGNMLGPGDGSYCGAQMAGTMKWGFLPSDTPGLEVYGSLPQGTAASGRLFGRSRSEIMKWTDKAKPFQMSEAPRIKTADALVEGVTKKYMPFQICSGWGFKYKGFDEKYGVHIYVRSGSWSHSMQIVAVFCIKGQWFVVIRNQWGQSAAKGSPEIGIPKGCMVITLETFAQWIRSAEVMGIGEIKGRSINPGA